MKVSLLRSFAPVSCSTRHVYRRRASTWRTATLLSGDGDALLTSTRTKLEELSQDASLLFCGLSRTLPPEVLGALVSLLQDRAEAASAHLLGALTDALPGGVNGSGAHAVSLAALRLSPGQRVAVFRSTIPGKPKIALGREVKQELVEERDFNMATRHTSEDFRSAWGAQEARTIEPPTELRRLDPATVETLLFATDDMPEGTLAALDNAFPDATKIGLIGSSTPFVTGRPFSLLQSRNILSDGIVGVAICSDEPKPATPRVLYGGLEALSGDLKVTDAQGNIVLTLDDKPATRLLLDLIKQKDASISSASLYEEKESEFFCGRVDPQTDNAIGCSSIDRIVSGDPSKGVMAVDTEDSLAPGALVRLFARRKSAALSLGDDSSGLRFLATGEDGAPAVSEGGPNAKASELQGFVAASEHGFVVSRGSTSRVCSVPGAIADILV